MYSLTTENFKELAAQCYLTTCHTNETEFEKDLSLAMKISQQINKMERGDSKANTRLLINYVITFFNQFKYEFAREMLLFAVEERNHGRLLSILIGTNRASKLHILGVTPCVSTLEIIQRELAT